MKTLLQQLIEEHDPDNIRVIKHDDRGDTWRYKGGLNTVSRQFYLEHLGLDLMVVREHSVGPEFAHLFEHDAAYSDLSGERLIMFQSLSEADGRRLIASGYTPRRKKVRAHKALDGIVFVPIGPA